MEKNKTQKGDNIYYELEDKPFWAAFLNLARHNAYIIIHHINKSLDLLKESGIEENPILSKFDFVPKEGEKTEAKRKREEEILQEKTEYWEKIERDLNRKMRYRDLILKHFPFIKAAAYRAVMNENKSRKSYEKMGNATMLEKASSYENVKSLITKFLIILKDLRNYYSHHKHSQSGTMPVFDEELINYLDDIFDASLQKVKDDYKHHETIKFSKDFNHLERKGKNTKFQYTFTESGKIKKEGLLFFISLFLEKKDAIWMQKKIKGFKGGDSDYKKMTNEVFCRSHILLPKLKLESDPSQTKNWALLDMLNELVRCPKSLYDRLHEDDRKKFQVPVDVAEEEETADNPFKNTLIRSQDRFPYFVLRFFDANELFDSLRFQIDLGNYHFSIYKKMIGGQLEDRHLTRNLYGFARIQEYDETHQPDDWKAKVKELGYEETSATPYIAKTTPHYHLENEKIGIKFVDNNTHIWPKLETEKTANNKDKFKNGEAFTADAFLSVHELMPMLFYYFLLKKEEEEEEEEKKNKEKDKEKKSCAKTIEDYIRKKKEDLFAVYEDFASNKIKYYYDDEKDENVDNLKNYLKDKDILIGHLPKQMISILSDEHKDMEEAAKKKIKFMKDDTQKRLKYIEKYFKQEDETEEKNIGVPKVGKIASWLVEDFMRFQPIDKSKPEMQRGNTKANSTEYQLLQRTLALFSSEKDRLGRYLNQTRLTGSNNPHPFLKETYWKRHTHLLSFYRSYLNERNKFLNNIQPTDWEKYQHILRLKTPKDNRKTLVEGWKNGFCLPRGIFTEKIKEWFEKHKPNIKICNYDKETWRVGFVPKAISLYFQEVCKDAVQPFYSYSFNVGNPLFPKNGRYEDADKRAELWKENKKRNKNICAEINDAKKRGEEIEIEKTKEVENIKNQINEIFQQIANMEPDEQESKLRTFQSKLYLLETFEKKLKSKKKDYQKEKLEKLQNDLLKSADSLPSNFKAWQKFERELRQIKNQDILTWMMCKELWKEQNTENLQTDEILLSAFNTNAAGKDKLNILNTIQPMMLPVKVSKFKKEETEQETTIYIKEENTKLLKQGNFKALVKDRRLSGLLSFVNTENTNEEKPFIHKLTIEHELEQYQHKRIKIFEITLGLEKELIEKYQDTTSMELPTDNFSKMLKGWMTKKGNKNDYEKKINLLIKIRNGFSHNQYPIYSPEMFGDIRLFDLTAVNTTTKVDTDDNKENKKIVKMDIAEQLMKAAENVKKEIEKEEGIEHVELER